MAMEKVVVRKTIDDLDMFVDIRNDSSTNYEAKALYDIYSCIKSSVPDRKSAIDTYNKFDSSFNMTYHLIHDMDKYMNFLEQTRYFLENTKKHDKEELEDISDILFDLIMLSPRTGTRILFDETSDTIRTFYNTYTRIKKTNHRSAKENLSEIHSKIEWTSKTFINSNDSFRYISDYIENFGKEKACQEPILQGKWSNRQY